jgi:hypothetical protein
VADLMPNTAQPVTRIALDPGAGARGKAPQPEKRLASEGGVHSTGDVGR